jgi:hypothetical protein
MTYRATVLGCVFLLLALVLAVCELLGVFEFVTEHKASAYIVVGSCVVAGVTPALPALADWAWRARHYVWMVGAWIAFGICLTIVLVAAIQRTGTATDGAQKHREQAERAAAVAVTVERQAAADYAAAQAAALKECDVRGKKCMDAEDKASRARAALAQARAALVAAPIGAQVDPMARRLAAVTTLTEQQVQLLYPLLLPVALSILSALFFAGWTRLDFLPAHVPAQTLQAAPLPTPLPTPPIPSIAPPAAKFGAVDAYLVSRTEPVAGSEIECERDMYGDYKDWCEAADVSPYRPTQFATELVRVGQAAGLAIEIRGSQAYVLDRRLAA